MFISNAIIRRTVAFGVNVPMLYEWPAFGPNIPHRNLEIPSRDVVEKTARACKELVIDWEGAIAMIPTSVDGKGIDGEGWETRWDEHYVEDRLRVVCDAIEWAKGASGGIKIGMFGFGTMGTFQQNWLSRNNDFWLNRRCIISRILRNVRIKKLLDFVCPVLYTEEPNNPNRLGSVEAWWTAWATNECEAAKEWAKPIRPFLSLLYSGNMGPISASLTAVQLDFCGTRGLNPIFWHEETIPTATLPGYASVKAYL